jgi:hypothetical protein
MLLPRDLIDGLEVRIRVGLHLLGREVLFPGAATFEPERNLWSEAIVAVLLSLCLLTHDILQQLFSLSLLLPCLVQKAVSFWHWLEVFGLWVLRGKLRSRNRCVSVRAVTRRGHVRKGRAFLAKRSHSTWGLLGVRFLIF